MCSQRTELTFTLEFPLTVGGGGCGCPLPLHLLGGRDAGRGGAQVMVLVALSPLITLFGFDGHFGEG